MMQRTVIAGAWDPGPASVDGVNDDEPCYVNKRRVSHGGRARADAARRTSASGLLTPKPARAGTSVCSLRRTSRGRSWIKSLMEDLGINLAGVEVLMRMQARLVELERQVRHPGGAPGQPLTRPVRRGSEYRTWYSSRKTSLNRRRSSSARATRSFGGFATPSGTWSTSCSRCWRARDSVPSRILNGMGVNVDRTRGELEIVLKKTPQLAYDSNQLHPTPRAMAMLQAAKDEAERLQRRAHRYRAPLPRHPVRCAGRCGAHPGPARRDQGACLPGSPERARRTPRDRPAR